MVTVQQKGAEMKNEKPYPQRRFEHIIRFPKEDSHSLGQNETFFFLNEGGHDQRINFHDYDAIYKRPGLYEQLFYERLRCNSPHVVTNRLARAIEHCGESIETQRVLDLGAGNGIVADELKALGVARLIGLDIIPEARTAALRDRPGAYDEYFVADMTALASTRRADLEAWRLTTLTCVAALGFDDIPPAAFLTALDLIAENGWVAFNIKTDFLQEDGASPFAALVKALLDRDLVDLHLLERYRHRLSIDGEWLEYFVLVARKHGHMPADIREKFG